jgi:hypothetical protein
MSRSRRDEIVIIPVDRLYSKYECMVEARFPDLLGQLNLDAHLTLFLDACLKPDHYGLAERETDFVTDLMMYDASRVDAEQMLSEIKAITKGVMVRHAGRDRFHLVTDWEYLNKRKDSIVLLVIR